MMKLDNVSVLIAEQAEPIRAAMLAMLKQQGINACRGVHDLKRMRTAVKEQPYDLIVAADDLDPEIFRFLRSIRMHDAGPNPFSVITVMVDQSNARSLKRAMICGADDILLKPVVPRKVVERAKYIAYNRLPFAATKDYIGPYRKQLGLSERTPVTSVLNTLRDKMEGKTFTLETLRDAVNTCMTQVRGVQLDSLALRLEYTCSLVLKAYENRAIGPEVQSNLADLTDSLREAAKIAKTLHQPDLVQTCMSLATRIEAMAENYTAPHQDNINLLTKLTQAFSLAKEQAAAAA